MSVLLRTGLTIQTTRQPSQLIPIPSPLLMGLSTHQQRVPDPDPSRSAASTPLSSKADSLPPALLLRDSPGVRLVGLLLHETAHPHALSAVCTQQKQWVSQSPLVGTGSHVLSAACKPASWRDYGGAAATEGHRPCMVGCCPTTTPWLRACLDGVDPPGSYTQDPKTQQTMRSLKRGQQTTCSLKRGHR